MFSVGGGGGGSEGGGGWRHIVWAIISLSCISLIVVEKELFLLNRTE